MTDPADRKAPAADGHAPTADAASAIHVAMRSERPGISRAEWMILIATIVFSISFAVAKESGAALNRAAGYEQSAFGPLVVLALRFTIAGIVWAVLFKGARAGWSWTGARRGLIVGSALTLGMVVQHIGLDYTSEAVSAFLTSLTVIFVPLVIWMLFGDRPPLSAYLGIALAVPGVWLMSGISATSGAGIHFGIGEALGLACAIAFSFHLISVNAFTPLENPWRMALAQFAVAAVLCWLVSLVLFLRAPAFDTSVLSSFAWWRDILLLALGPTVIGFGLMTIFQPQISPVRAVLIYMLEPVFAATFAWYWSGSAMTAGMILGGGLILGANAVVELIPILRKRREATT